MITLIDPAFTALLRSIQARGLDPGSVLIDSLCRASLITGTEGHRTKTD